MIGSGKFRLNFYLYYFLQTRASYGFNNVFDKKKSKKEMLKRRNTVIHHKIYIYIYIYRPIKRAYNHFMRL